MSESPIAMPNQAINSQSVWARYFSIALPLLLGFGLGLPLAFSIVQGQWFGALALALLVPAAVLLISYPWIAIIVWLLLMPFIPTNNISPVILWVIHRSVIPLALIIIILARMLRIKKYPPVHWMAAEATIVMYLVFAVASILFTRSAPQLYLYELYDKAFVPFAAYGLIRLSSPREQDLKRLIPVMLIVYLGEIVMGFWARYASQSLPPLWTFERIGKRMSGTFNNPNFYAYLMVLLMAFLFHYAMNHTNKILRTFLVILFGLGIVCIFLTFTRACWLAGILVLLGLALLYPRPIFSLTLAVGAIMLVLSTTVLASEFRIAFQRLITEDTVNSRLVLAHAGEQMFLAKPLLGWGYTSYDLYDWQFMERVGDAAPRAWDIQIGTSHDTYLTILAETGMVGFSFYFFPVLWWLIRTIKTWRHLPKRGFWSWRLLVIMWLSIVAYLSIGTIIDMRFSWFSLGTFWLTLGLIGNLEQTSLNPLSNRGAPEQIGLATGAWSS
jgi:O-antigen ligase